MFEMVQSKKNMEGLWLHQSEQPLSLEVLFFGHIY